MILDNRTMYEQIPAAIRIPDVTQADLRISVQLIAMDAVGHARMLADRADARCYEALNPLRTLERLGFLDASAVSTWFTEIETRFNTGLADLLSVVKEAA